MHAICRAVLLVLCRLEAGDGYDCPGSDSDTDCAIGDLSGKFGALDGPHNHESHVDTNLPLFGSHTIIGRSITIHASDGSRLMCSTIEFALPTVVHTVLLGDGNSIRFEQAAGYPTESPTTILLNLESYPEEEGHGWAILENRVNSLDCDMGGDYYNPLGVQPSNCTVDLTDEEKMEQCEVGNLAGKHGTLDLPASNVAFADAYLPLSGQKHSIRYRSAALYGADNSMEVLDCGNLMTSVSEGGVSSSASDDEGSVSSSSDTSSDSSGSAAASSESESDDGFEDSVVLPVVAAAIIAVGGAFVGGYYAAKKSQRHRVHGGN